MSEIGLGLAHAGIPFEGVKTDAAIQGLRKRLRHRTSLSLAVIEIIRLGQCFPKVLRGSAFNIEKLRLMHSF